MAKAWESMASFADGKESPSRVFSEMKSLYKKGNEIEKKLVLEYIRYFFSGEEHLALLMNKIYDCYTDAQEKRWSVALLKAICNILALFFLYSSISSSVDAILLSLLFLDLF